MGNPAFSEPRALTLDGERRLTYEVVGDPDGRPLMMFHGTPGSRLQLTAGDADARRLGVSLILPDRPGYGGSSYVPGRTLLDWASDVAAIADALGLERFAVAGLSGGGPFALACAHVLPERVSAALTVGGVAPTVPRDPRLPPPRALSRVAGRSEWMTQAAFRLLIGLGRRWPERSLDRFARLLAEPDRQMLLRDSPVRRSLLEDLRRPSATAARAAAREFRLFAHHWGFEPAEIDVPVHIWHGTEDRNVPPAHASVLMSRCPTATLHMVEGAGHFLVADRAEAVLAALDG